MKRKEPEPSQEAQTNEEANQANSSSSSVHESVPPSKRAKLKESDSNESQPIASTILERFASASRQRIAQLMQQGTDRETAFDHLVSQLTTSSISDQTPSYTLADIKMIRKLTGFNPSQAERVLLLREEICLLSRQLSADPADVVDTLTDRLTSESLPNLKKRHREGVSSIDSTLERPAKRLRESDEKRAGKRSFSDTNDVSPPSGTPLSTQNATQSSSATPELIDSQKRRKIHENSYKTFENFDFVIPTSLISSANLANPTQAPSSSSSSSNLPMNSLVQSLQSAFQSRMSSSSSTSGQTAPGSSFSLTAHENSSVPSVMHPSSSPLSEIHQYEPDSSSFSDSGGLEWPGSPGSSTPADKAPHFQAVSSPPFFGFGPSTFPFAPPGAAAAARGRSRLTESGLSESRLDDASSVHSDDKSVASSLQVHPSHSGGTQAHTYTDRNSLTRF